jgi:hypothetical protein
VQGMILKGSKALLAPPILGEAHDDANRRVRPTVLQL